MSGGFAAGTAGGFGGEISGWLDRNTQACVRSAAQAPAGTVVGENDAVVSQTGDGDGDSGLGAGDGVG